MTGTACPSCNAPAPPGARECGRCGYRFVEGGPGPAARPSAGPLLGAVAALAVAIGVAAVLLLGGDDRDDGGRGSPTPAALETTRRLEVLSEHPLATSAVERRLEGRFTELRDDDSAAVSCSEREAKPAHSIRRCRVRYPSGLERVVVLLTNASGSEVISEP
jgi:hypothetical protein